MDMGSFLALTQQLLAALLGWALRFLKKHLRFVLLE
jgi:hypothetical protein